MPEFIVILTTTDDQKTARSLARVLVETKTAACVTISENVTSVYRWQGKIQEDSEHLLIIKTEAGKFSAAEKIIKNLHNYDLPEVLAFKVTEGSASYLEWARDSLR